MVQYKSTFPSKAQIQIIKLKGRSIYYRSNRKTPNLNCSIQIDPPFKNPNPIGIPTNTHLLICGAPNDQVRNLVEFVSGIFILFKILVLKFEEFGWCWRKERVE